ncbi:MAG TPA: ABC transporter permease [Asticcacaulis sp.]|nr:ABC transporter permease [Asticcacaulis sp.]
MYAKAINDLVRGLALYKIWIFQAWHEMTAKYKRTVLGSFWLAGQMVVTSLCLSLVWGLLMGRDMHDILPYITCGVMCFQMITFIFNEGPGLFLGSGSMIKNHAWPFSYYVAEAICRIILTFAHNVLIFFVVEACVMAFAIPHWTLLLGFPIVIVAIASWGTVTGMVAARFRDMVFVLPYVGQLLFYVTPIIWRVSDISSKRAFVAHYNPLYGLLEVIRAPLLGHAPPPGAWALALGTMVTGVIAWLLVFSPFRRRIPFWV